MESSKNYGKHMLFYTGMNKDRQYKKLNMTSNYLLTETLTAGYKVEILFVLSLISIFFGVSTIITKNPIFSVLFLIGLFLTISIYLMMMGLYFIGLSYLLVYVGAISILFLFILMLINVRISELLTEGRNGLFLAGISILAFNLSTDESLPYSVYVSDIIYGYIVFVIDLFKSFILWLAEFSFSNLTFEYNPTLFEIGNVSGKSWDTLLVENSHITSIGNILYTNLFIYLFIIGLILLLSMVGTIIITIKGK